jgi:hypothetical protein
MAPPPESRSTLDELRPLTVAIAPPDHVSADRLEQAPSFAPGPKLPGPLAWSSHLDLLEATTNTKKAGPAGPAFCFDLTSSLEGDITVGILVLGTDRDRLRAVLGLAAGQELDPTDHRVLGALGPTGEGRRPRLGFPAERVAAYYCCR